MKANYLIGAVLLQKRKDNKFVQLLSHPINDISLYIILGLITIAIAIYWLKKRNTKNVLHKEVSHILNNHFYFDAITIIDLFAGTGNISYEFASRGAKNITSVDNNHKCVNFIKLMSNELNYNIRTIRSDVFKFLKSIRF